MRPRALQRLQRLLRSPGQLSRLLARLLVCAYYLNIVASEVEVWHNLRSVEAQRRFLRWREPEHVPLRELPFPALRVCVLVPAALLVAADVPLAWLPASLLLGFTVWRDARLTWAMIVNMFRQGGGPTELLLKQLAIMGSATVVLACAVKAAPPRLQRATAGLLRVDDDDARPRVGMRRSTALLLGRLLMAALLLFAGGRQALRVRQRLQTGPVAPEQNHFGRPDARDNNWLLLECALAVPLALGVMTGPVSLLLCGALLGEAALHWRWWGGGFPSWHYRQNVRDHFFTNAAVAGGLLLTQSMGDGLLSVDALLAAKRD